MLTVHGESKPVIILAHVVPAYVMKILFVFQGRIEMWVDMFPKDMPLPNAATDITPRKTLM